MTKKEFETAYLAIPGTPAAYWATVEPNALVNAIDKHNATHVYVSLGGDDLMEGLYVGMKIDPLFNEMMSSTQKILEKVFEARPHVHVYHFGYEILDWDGSAYCQGFSGLLKPFCPNLHNISCMTHTQAKWLQFKFTDALSKRYANNSHFHGLNLLGTLQVCGHDRLGLLLGLASVLVLVIGKMFSIRVKINPIRYCDSCCM